MDEKPTNKMMLLTNGMRFDPVSKKVIDVEKERTNAVLSGQIADLSLADMKATERRQLHEITEETALLNVCIVVFVYELLGIAPHEIAYALKATEEKIAEVKATREFATLTALFTSSVEKYIQSSVRGQFAIASYRAALTMIEGLNSPSADIKHASAKDVLDRAGHRPADIVEHRHSHEDELVIRVIQDKGHKEIDISLDA